jgi:Phage portal protein
MDWRSWLGIADPPAAKYSVEVPPEMREGMTAGGNIEPRISRGEALQVPAVLRSRNLIASTLARLPVHIRDKERRIATPTTLLEQIDPDIPNVVTFAQTYEDLLFESVSWWRVLKVGWHGYPESAQHIDGSRVTIAGWSPPVSGLASILPTEQRVYIDGRPVADDEVIRFDSPNPPLLRHAARAIRTCLQLDKTATNYANDPVPLGYFTPREGMRPREDKEAIEEMLDQWEEARRRRVWGYVGAALEGKQFQFDAEQIQLAQQRQHAVLEIARAAGVDPEDLGVSTTSRTYQNSEQRRQDLIDFTLAAYVSAIEQRLSMRDVIPRGYETKVNFDGFLRADTKTRMDAYKVGADVGAYTVPEIRELEDRPALARIILPGEEQQPPAPNGQRPQSEEAEVNG